MTSTSAAAMPAMPESAKVAVADSKLGKILADDKGMTLYMYTKDTDGVSVCYDKCAIAWPPLLSKGDPTAGDGVTASLLGTVARKDGSLQVTYAKMPLYYYIKDGAPGDVVGQDVGKVWYVVSPEGKVIEDAAAAAPATAAGAKVMVADTSLGKILAGPDGRTLYMFTKDANGESACYDACATNWPPLITKDKPAAGDGVDATLLGTVARTDGSMQVTYKGMPLYYYAKDKAAGDTVGQKVGNAWYVVAPSGDVMK